MQQPALADVGFRIAAVHEEETALVRKRKAATHEESIGERLSRLRKERGITQQEMAERLDLAQPNISDYERGILRLHGEIIVKIAAILGAAADEILGLDERKANGSTIKNRRLLRRIQEIDRLPKRDQQALLRTVDAFLSKAQTG